MNKKLIFSGVIFLVLAALAVSPISVRAEGDSPPTPEPVKPPLITGKNPHVSLATFEGGDLGSGGVTFPGQGLVLPLMAPPSYIELEAQETRGSSSGGITLGIPQTFQDPGDPTCGAASLAMALQFLSLGSEVDAPSQVTLISNLKNTGLLYKEGTGVEELAYLARRYGFQGSTAFHNWTLEKLAGELSSGHPVVVALGSNGNDQPGHFVTLTGIGHDGSWVKYNDPILGEQTLSAADFMAKWSAQGNSGMTVQKEVMAAANDPMLPWMGLFSAITMLAVIAKYYPNATQLTSTLADIRGILSNPTRKGLGGKLDPGGAGSYPHPTPEGYRWVQKSVPKYGWKEITVTKSRQVPIFEKKKVQVDTRVWYVKVPRYRTVRVDKGHWVRKKVTKYRRQKYVRYYRTTRVKKTRWVRRGWRFVRQTYYVTKRTPVYGYKNVPYTTYQREWKSNWVTEKVFDGYRSVRKEEPVYEYLMMPSGRTKTEYYKTTEKRWGVLGTELEWKLVKDPSPLQGNNDKKSSSGSGGVLKSEVIPNDIEDNQESMPDWLNKEEMPPGFDQDEWDAYPMGFKNMILDEYMTMWENGEELPTWLDTSTDPTDQDVSVNGTDLEMPDWLKNRSKPPNISQNLWDSLPPGEKNAILQDYLEEWKGGENSPPLINVEQPKQVPDSVWDNLTKSEKYTLSIGQNQDLTRLIVLSSIGMNIRSDAVIGDNIVHKITTGTPVEWDGEIKIDNAGRTWLYINLPGLGGGWMAWRNPDGELLAELAPKSASQTVTLACENDGTCMDNYGDYYDWGGPYQEGSAAQFMNIQNMLDDLGLDINLTYGDGVHRNLCGVIAAAYVAGIPVEQAVKVFLDIAEDVILKNEPYDNGPIEDFFQELGYLTNNDNDAGSKINSIDYNASDGSISNVYHNPDTGDTFSDTIDGMIIGVNIDTSDGGKCTSDSQSDGDVVGHWVALLEYDQENKIAVIYNPYNNRREFYTDDLSGDVENNLSFNKDETNPDDNSIQPTYGGSWDSFAESWWGGALQVEK